MPRQKPDEEKRSMHVSARITRTEYDALVEMAEQDDRTESYLVAKAIREFLERHASKHAPRRPK
jgi:predicted transcriptional regulator